MTIETLQQDIFQRYTCFRQLMIAAFPPPQDGTLVLVLDIGSGPERLAERVLPPYFSVTRADVETFGDAAVVLLTPGGTLPFEDRSFPAVVALEVLEHVPDAGRDGLIGECARVSSSVVVVCCPVASGSTERAEEVFQTLAAEVSGTTVPFLSEHKAAGLPDAALTRVALQARMPHVVDLPNSPLPEWLVYNLVDLAYACDFGDVDEKARFNVRVNSRTPLARTGLNYRQFFVGCRDARTSQRVTAAAQQVSTGTKDPLSVAIGAAEAIVQFRADLLRKHAESLRESLQAKDAHIHSLDQVIARLQDELRQKDALPGTAPAPTAMQSVSALRAAGERAWGHVADTPPRTHREPKRRPTLLRRGQAQFRTMRLGKGVPRHWKVMVAESGLFDPDFYRARHPDVAASGVDPIVHYLAVGAEEGRNPHPLFDAAYYRAQAPSLTDPRVNPLVHYVTTGAADGRTPHPLFEPAFYAARHPEAAGSGSTPLGHYVATGAQTRSDPSPLFWAGYYLDTNPDVTAARHNPLTHYVLCGASEGRNPNPLFDAAYYRAGAGGEIPVPDPLRHYLAEGAAHGYDPHALFSTRYYLETYPDVAAAGLNPLTHYIQKGGPEGRNPNPLFDTAFYLAGGALPPGTIPLAHYVAGGAASGRTPHPLFDPAYYLAAHPEVGAHPGGALGHYLVTGAQTRWNPSPVFWSAYYLERNSDVAETGDNPLAHYVRYGAAEGRNPNPLFDGAYYLARNPDVAANGLNPLVHYLQIGAAEGRKPSALFDTVHYVRQNPDVAAAGVNPLAHYLEHGWKEGRAPNPLFDPVYYLSMNPDLEAANVHPLVHFIERGAIEGLNPSPLFDTSYYLRENPDVAALGLNPLAHYLDHGVEEGRTPRPHDTTLESSPVVRFVPPTGLLPWFNPLNLQIARSLEEAPSLNVLVPGLGMQHMSGGPNTALHIAYRLGIAGVRVRFISTDAPLGEREALWRHVQQLAGSEERLPHVEFVDGYDRRRPLAIGRNDVFFATAWWTAQMAKFGCDLTRTKRFIYLVQDYEPLFHPASTPQALALETYSLDYVPVVNSKVLFDYLTENRVGRFASPEFARQALIFEPAVDRSHFFMEPAAPDRPKRLLFYARPTTGLRNMYELGVAALMDTIARGVFDDQPWEMLAMGEAISPVDLGHGFTLNPAPWLDFARYAGQMRQSDILVSLMLSPHPSYPPLEMAACGGLVVTNTYDCKTSERLAQVSPNIIGADPTFESVAEAITTSVRRLADDAQRRLGSTLDLPPTWAASLAPVVDRLRPVLLGDLGVPTELAVGPDGRQLPSRVPCGFDRWPMNRYEVHRIDRLRERRRRGAIATQAGLFSFVTAVWNTDRAMLECLADSLLNQTNPAAFEWVILDNGSERKETLDVLERIRQHPVVRLHRSPTNLGIVRGLRQCIELAANRYVLFVDHDDFVSPDCVDVVAAFVEERGYPALFYTDEEKIAKHGYGNGYMKPDWDPVLFVNSCFIAHLCGVDRQLALELSCCDDPGSEGSHDWDTFMRFVLAGHVPQHLPETLYTWRAHEGSTAENIHSKPYVFASQQHVLRKFLKAQPQSAVFRLEKSPLFGDSPDWWIRRAEEDPQPITTVRWSSVERAPARQVIPVDPAIPHDIIEVAGQCDIAELRRVARECSETGRLLHLMSAEVDLDGPEWAWEAMGLLALFPDAAMVGGRIHNGTRILTAGQMFGFEAGCGSPDRGRLLQDPGYFGQMWKPHSVSAVSCQHAVVHAKFLLDALDALEGVPMSLANLGAWLGGQARRARRRVVYSPFLSGRVYRDMEEDIPARERGYFRVVNADLIPESELWSPHLGLSRATAYLPVSEQTRRSEIEPQASDLLAYPEWLSARIVARKRHYALSASPPSLSVLTTVYSGTPARIFAATADSLARQSYPFSEWVILAHGAISRDLELALQQEEKAPNVRVLRRPDNLGIVGGMRECLLAAQGKYIVPVDADDLLTTDALQVIASAIERRSSRPVLVYSDEDVWCGEEPQSPYVRPDFDPVLNLETSYVWHVCAIRRDAALEGGLYTDPGVEYCHDWDSVTRLALLEPPVHVPEVLYHWRQHAVSHTNRGEQHPGSLASTRHLLERRIAALADPELFDVGEFPLFRGAREWYVRRKPIDPPAVALIVKASTGLSARFAAGSPTSRAFPFVTVETVRTSQDLLSALRALAEGGSARYVAMVSDVITTEGDEWIWEAVRLFECHPDVGLCGGRLTDRAGRIAGACLVLANGSQLVNPFADLDRLDPGPFALALKPHLVATVPDAFHVVATDLLSDHAMLEALSGERAPGLAAAAEAWARGRMVAYSPLIEARLHGSHAAPGAPRDAGEINGCALSTLKHALAGRRLGMSGFVSLRRQFRP